MLPNLVIAGAPKCGTTSLFNWLVDHPDVGGAKEKETFYLVDEGFWLQNKKYNYHIQGLSGYEKYFNHCNGKKIIMEGSTPYLYQATALQVLSQLKTKVIFVLREPAARLYSNYKYYFNVKALQRSHLTFSEYVEKLFNREMKTGNQQIDHGLEHGCYVTYLDNWYREFSHQQVLILYFEDIVADPKSQIDIVADWLGIDRAFYNNYVFEAENASYEVKNFTLHRWSRFLADHLPHNALRNSLKSMYRNINAAKSKGKSQADTQTLNKVKAYYSPFNQRLVEVLGGHNPW